MAEHKDCSTCRWRPAKWEADLSYRERLLGDCRAPVPFWLADGISTLAAPLDASADDYRTLTQPRDGGAIVGLWADDFPGCDAWEAERPSK